MSPRKIGSGTASPEANACARILAALFVGDKEGLRDAQDEFSEAQERRQDLGAGDGRGFTASELTSLLKQVPRTLSHTTVRSAVACAPGEAGDVLVEVGTGPKVRIEIKAQLTLEDFTWIQSADWIRAETDFLGALLEQERGAGDGLTDDVRNIIVDAYVKDSGWDLSALWVADVAGLTNRSSRQKFGVTSRKDLDVFLAHKYVVHLTQEGLRMFRMSEIPKLKSALSAGVKYCLFGARRGSQLTVWTRGDGRPPKRGGIHLTYYIGQKNRPDLGGHHMHNAFFEGAVPLLLLKKPNR